MRTIKMMALPLVLGVVVVGGAAYWANKNSAKVISMVDGVRTWINKKMTKEAPAAEAAAKITV